MLIAAVAENRVIGNGSEIPWHIPEDFKHFKKTTSGYPVIMGKTTYDSILGLNGEPLPNRENIVLSFEPFKTPRQVSVVHSIQEALDAAENTGAEKAFIIGGASVYKQFLDQDLVDTMILTHVHKTPVGDVHFPEWDETQWEKTGETRLTDAATVAYYHKTS